MGSSRAASSSSATPAKADPELTPYYFEVVVKAASKTEAYNLMLIIEKAYALECFEYELVHAPEE